MLFPVLNWRLPSELWRPVWLGLDWKELMGWPLPLAWHLSPHWSREEGRQHKEGHLALAHWAVKEVQGVVSGCLHLKPVRPEPTPLGRSSYAAATNHLQNHQRCSLACLTQLCHQPHSLLVPPTREDANRGWGKEYLQAA